MKLMHMIVLSVLCAATQAITFSTIATVSLALISLNKPVSCFFGIFRRRKASPIQETTAPPQADTSFFQSIPISGGMFNPFGGYGAGGMFFPSLGPGFGLFGNRFPPQFSPSRPMAPIRVQPVSQVQKFPQQPSMQQLPLQNMPPVAMQPDMSSFRDPREEIDDVPGMNTEEAESFFTLLSETDESKCISRLVCEMGANPESGGEFGQTIVEIIGSLKDFPDGSKVSEYNEVLNVGVVEGLSSCLSKFSVCDEESYQLVKRAQLEDEGQSK